MKYAYKTELKPTKEQAKRIREQIGICRFLYNEYISFNNRLYKMRLRGLLDENQAHFMTAKDFDKYINNKVKVKDEFKWINKCGSKPRKKAIVNAEYAFKRYFAGRSALPKFKKKDDEDVALYFPKNNPYDWIIERHRIKIPTLGFARLKEYGYLPVGAKVINGNVSHKAGRYYVSVTLEKEGEEIAPSMDKIGVSFCLSSKENKNADEDSSLKKLDERIKRAQKVLNRKKKTAAARSANQEKQKLKIRKLRQKQDFILTDRFNKAIAQIVKERPKCVILPDLSGEIYTKDKDVLRRIYKFRNRLLLKCAQKGIELKYAADFKEIGENIKITAVKI